MKITEQDAMKLYTDTLVKIIEADTFTPRELFGMDDIKSVSIIKRLLQDGIVRIKPGQAFDKITPDNMFDYYFQIAATKLDELPVQLKKLLNDNTYTDEMLNKAFANGETDTKTIVSEILSEDRLWQDVNESTPRPFLPIVIRLVDTSQVLENRRTSITFMEDIKIGYIDDSGKYHILPPHPTCDYSPISERDELKSNTSVSHWAIPENDEVNDWICRYDRVHGFPMDIILSGQEDNVYTALMHAAACIRKCYGPAVDDPKTDAYRHYTIICDMQSTMDIDYAETHLIDRDWEEQIEKACDRIMNIADASEDTQNINIPYYKFMDVISIGTLIYKYIFLVDALRNSRDFEVLADFICDDLSFMVSLNKDVKEPNIINFEED